MSRASAPASSANLGPGYDVLALALDLRCRVQLCETSSWDVSSGGASAGAGAQELVRQAVDAAVPGSGPFSVDIDSDIPIARGLGSSAAVIVAVAAAVRALAGESAEPESLFGPAVLVEGHPDNIAAALYGGLVGVAPSGEVHALEMHPSLAAVVAVPESSLPTREARLATAQPVSTEIASRTAARLALLVDGLRSGDPERLRAAAGDELHEARRAHLSPISGLLMEAAREAGAHHAAWSGSGPAVVAIADLSAVAAIAAALGETLAAEGGKVLTPEIDRRGLIVG